MQFLDVSFVKIQLGDRARDLRVGEDPELLAAVDEALDLFQFLQVRYRHLIPFPSLAAARQRCPSQYKENRGDAPLRAYDRYSNIRSDYSHYIL